MVARRSRAAQPSADMTKVRVVPQWMDISDIEPYPYNPRDNRKAIAAVAKSIKNFGFIVPIVVDRNGVVAAGHTRLEAAKSLQMTEVLVINAEHLTPEQIDAFRVVDNKTAELADWDTDLLGPEMARLQEVMGDTFSFVDYGWTQEEVDCLTQVVADDCLSTADLSQTTETMHITERRAPATTRIVIGEIVFFVPAQVYRNWADGLRRLHNLSEADIVADIKNRLGILED